MADVTPGWFPDPYGRYDERYWDGTQWTDRVRRGEEESVDPLGTSMGIPFATPTDGDDAADDEGETFTTSAEPSALDRFLESLGPDAKERARPHLRDALSGLGGVAITVGAIAVVVPDSGDVRWPLCATSAVALVIALVARLFVHVREVRAAAVGVGLVAIPLLGGTLTISDPNVDYWPSLLIALLFLAAWALPGFKGRNLFLGLGAVLLLVGINAAVSSDDQTVDECLALEEEAMQSGDWEAWDAQCAEMYDDFSVVFLPPEWTDAAGDTGIVLLVGAAAYLGGMWWLDRRGYHGTATALAAAALGAAIAGAGLIAVDYGDSAGLVVVLLTGAALTAVGSIVGRRATTWIGALLAAVGLVGFTALQVEPTSNDANGLMYLVCGALLIVIPIAVGLLRRDGRERAPAGDDQWRK